MSKPTCAIESCESVAVTRGWCATHYSRWRRYGDPLAVRQIQGDDVARLKYHVRIDPVSGCWQWTGSLNPRGYGSMRWNGRAHPAHRVSFALLKGALVDGLDIDHLCRNRGCVNPDHLEQISHHTNLLRGATVASRNLAVTHCPQGHLYTPGNTYTPPGKDSRHCRTCRKAQRAAHFIRTGR